MERGRFQKKKNPDEVPGGIDVGLMFHDILEHMDYGVVLRAITKTRDPHLRLMHDGDTREIILRQMETHGVDERWKDSVCRILWNTLTAPIVPMSNSILAHLQGKDRLHEVEFLLFLSIRCHSASRNSGV